jgi:transcriptional regulator with XRE-family HTH domain
MNLRGIRVLKKISAEKAANELGVKLNLLYAYESGRVKPQPDFLKRAADFYSVSVDEIISEKNNSTNSLVEKSNNDITYWRNLVDEFREKERRYLDIIANLSMGKPLGNTGAVVVGFVKNRLQSGLHSYAMAA